MKKIVPFQKEVSFKTNIAEITSISLEHTLKLNNNTIDGEFNVSGEYKMADISTTTEKFDFNIPFSVEINDNYLLDKVVVDIDDFYYEIVNEKTLVVNIDVLINNLEEKPLRKEEKIIMPELEKELPQEVENRKLDIEEIIDDEIEEYIELENPIKIEDTTKKVDKQIDIFNSFTENESSSTYRVYIVREGDILETILEKYSTTKEKLEKYNNITEIKIGDKLIIPSE